MPNYQQILLLRTIKIILLAVFTLISIAPLAWILLSSFKTNREIMLSAFSLPSSFDFKGYRVALEVSPILRFYGNSLIIATASTILNLLFVSMTAYVFARFEFKGRALMALMISSSLLIPSSALLMPIYRIMVSIHLFDTIIGLILVHTALGLPTSFFVIRSYFQSIPKELEEAAYIDGCGYMKTFFVIVLPLAKSGLSTVAVLQFLMSWNEFMFALVLTKSEKVRTLPLALNYFTTQFSFNYTALFAALTMVILPSIIIYIILQEQVTQSMVTGAIKG